MFSSYLSMVISFGMITYLTIRSVGAAIIRCYIYALTTPTINTSDDKSSAYLHFTIILYKINKINYAFVFCV